MEYSPNLLEMSAKLKLNEILVNSQFCSGFSSVKGYLELVYQNELSVKKTHNCSYRFIE